MLATVLLALAASACWGTSDFTSGFKARTVPLPVVLMMSQGIGLALATILVLAAGRGLPGTGPALASLGAGVCAVVGLGCFYRALATGTMSIVAPIAATGVVIPVLAGVLGGNHLTALQVIGMFAAVTGVVLAARQSDAQAARLDRRAHRETVALAIVAAAAFGCYFLLAHIGVRGGVAWMLLLAHVTSVIGVIVLGLLTGMRRPRLALRGDLGVLALAGVLDFAATGLYGLANRHGQLSIVAVAGSLYPVATVLLARAILSERVVRLQALGVGLALAGVALIAA